MRPRQGYAGRVDRDEILRVLRAFEESGLDYVLIGATAMGFHGVVRATEAIDLFIRATADNVERLRAGGDPGRAVSASCDTAPATGDRTAGLPARCPEVSAYRRRRPPASVTGPSLLLQAGWPSTTSRAWRMSRRWMARAAGMSACRSSSSAMRGRRRLDSGQRAHSQDGVARSAYGSTIQFSTRNPLTRANSRSLAVTSARSRARAWLAISRSLPPIGVPAFSILVRTRA